MGEIPKRRMGASWRTFGINCFAGIVNGTAI
jgi:hypothetical protein